MREIRGVRGEGDMSLVCNVKKEEAAPPAAYAPERWDDVYRENERYVESGSSYFSHAFSEALGLVADIEMHDLERATLRAEAISALLAAAQEQYRLSMDIDHRSGLMQYHESQLRHHGLDKEGLTEALRQGRRAGYISMADESIKEFVDTFNSQGYDALMECYLTKVAGIQDLVLAMGQPSTDVPGLDWQGVGWRLVTSFGDAIQYGQSIAVMNSVTYRP
jgi:hypothetical protein